MDLLAKHIELPVPCRPARRQLHQPTGRQIL